MADDNKIDPQQVLTASQIAELAGWKDKGTATKMWQRGGFVKPVGKVGRSWVWQREAVEHWLATAKRRPGRRDS